MRLVTRVRGIPGAVHGAVHGAVESVVTAGKQENFLGSIWGGLERESDRSRVGELIFNRALHRDVEVRGLRDKFNQALHNVIFRRQAVASTLVLGAYVAAGYGAYHVAIPAAVKLGVLAAGALGAASVTAALLYVALPALVICAALKVIVWGASKMGLSESKSAAAHKALNFMAIAGTVAGIACFMLPHIAVPALAIYAVLKAAVVIGEKVGLVAPKPALSEDEDEGEDKRSHFHPGRRINGAVAFGKQVWHLLLSPYYLVNGAVKRNADNAFKRGADWANHPERSGVMFRLVQLATWFGSAHQLGRMSAPAQQLQTDATNPKAYEHAPSKVCSFFGGGPSRVLLASKLANEMEAAKPAAPGV